MATESTTLEHKNHKPQMHRHGGGGGSDAFYGIGLFGAWVYFIGRAETTEERIRGFFKGLVWPAFLVYQLFAYLEKE